MNTPIPFTARELTKIEESGYFLNEELPLDFQIYRIADRSQLLSEKYQGVLVTSYAFSLDTIDRVTNYCQLIVTNKPIEKYKDTIPQFIIKNTRVFMYNLAKYMRERYHHPVIGVTGSVGKSTTSKMICHLLQDEQTDALVNMGNHNNRASVAFYTSNIVRNPDYAVLELAGDSLLTQFPNGNLAELANLDIGMITSVGGAHLSRYKNDLNVAEIKAGIIDGIQPGGILVVTHDLPKEQMAIFMERANQRNIQVLTYSMDDPQANACLIEKKWDGQFSVVSAYVQGKFVSYRVPGGSDGVIQNSIGALLVLDCLGVDLTKERLAKFETSQTLPRVLMRREFERANKEHLTIIDDTHNSSVPSMHNAISYFKLLAASGEYTGTKLLILARIGDLGEQSQEIHYQFIQPIAEAKADYVLLFGPDMKELMKALRKQKIIAYYYEDPKEMVEEILELLDDQSLAVLKGSTAETDFQHVSFGLPRAIINQGGKQL